MIQEILILLSTIFIVHYFWSRREYYMLAIKMPRSLGLPFLGHALQVRKYEDILPYAESIRKNIYPRHGIIFVGPYPIFYTSQPESLKVIMTSPQCMNRLRFYKTFEDHFGSGLITSNSPKWNIHRKLIDPAFNIQILRNYLSIFNAEVNVLLEKLSKLDGKGDFNLLPLVQLLTLELSCQTTLGRKMKFQMNENGDLVKSVLTLTQIVVMRMANILYHFDFIFRFTKWKGIVDGCQKYIEEFMEKILVDKLEEVSQKNENDKSKFDFPNENETKRLIFMDRIAELVKSKQFTMKDATDEMNAVIGAAFETTANTVTNTLLCLAMHPEYQDRVFKEISEKFPDKNTDINYEDLTDLNYLEMCINENMRLMTPIPVVGRSASADVKVGDVTLPKGTQIIMDLFNMQRDTKFWGENARKFDPEHFSKEFLETRHPYAFVPFTKGTRNCIGSKYAMLSIKTILAKLLRNYRFETDFKNLDDLKFTIAISLKVKTVPHIRIFKRDE